MFGIGGIEFLIIAVVAIVVIGPAELPRVLYTLGKGIRKMREVSRSITDAFDDITRDAELDEIISKANTPGGDNLDFHAQQQKALEERRTNAEDSDGLEDADSSETIVVKKSSSTEISKKSSASKNKKKGD